MSLSTHVLDAAAGRPAAGVAVRLESHDGASWTVAARGRTDADGRIGELGAPAAGLHRIQFRHRQLLRRAAASPRSIPR